MDDEPGKKETEAPVKEVTPQEDTSQSEKKAEESKDEKSQADKVANKKSNATAILLMIVAVALIVIIVAMLLLPKPSSCNSGSKGQESAQGTAGGDTGEFDEGSELKKAAEQ